MHVHWAAIKPRVGHTLQFQRRVILPTTDWIHACGRRNRTVAAAKSQVSPTNIDVDATIVSEAVDAQASQGEVYQSFQGPPPEYPIAPPPVVQTDSGLPPWVWIVVGVLLANVFNKVMDFVRRPQEAMSEMMMKQMTNAMNTQMGGATGATSPGTNPFAYPPGGFPSGFPNQPASPVVDTWASAPTPPPAAAPPPPPPPPPAAPSAPTGAAQTSAMGNGFGTGFDPAGVSQQAAQAPPQPASSFFQDVGDTNAGQQPPAATPITTDAQIDQFFESLKDPAMRESLYQNLPESMRTPETLDMLMNNPMVRDQVRKMMKDGSGLQNFANAQAGMPANQGMDEAVQNQLKSMNVDPQVLSQKLMSDPDLVKLLNKPNVLTAVMDLQQHPEKLTTYMSDPEVMKVIMKMNELAMSVQAETGAQPQAPPGTAPQMPVAVPPSQSPVGSQPGPAQSPAPATSAFESMPSSTSE